MSCQAATSRCVSAHRDRRETEKGFERLIIKGESRLSNVSLLTLAFSPSLFLLLSLD